PTAPPLKWRPEFRHVSSWLTLAGDIGEPTRHCLRKEQQEDDQHRRQAQEDECNPALSRSALHPSIDLKETRPEQDNR
ncbi:MAG: hypothetical protein WA002_00160, partial [Candidatus Acidiferrales bacterium]